MKQCRARKDATLHEENRIPLRWDSPRSTLPPCGKSRCNRMIGGAVTSRISSARLTSTTTSHADISACQQDEEFFFELPMLHCDVVDSNGYASVDTGNRDSVSLQRQHQAAGGLLPD